MPPGLQTVGVFEGSRNVSLANSSVHIEDRLEAIHPVSFSIWKSVIAPSAFHNSDEKYNPPRCHPRTREALLGKIMSWVRGEIDTQPLVFWLNGLVGVGKSAMGQTIAEICEQEGLLPASFFFSRSNLTRNNRNLFVTTLAYQIALAVPHARRCIELAFEHDPVINTQSLETQVRKRVIEPLDIINQASDSIRASGGRLIFLVTSRSEQEIALKLHSVPMVHGGYLNVHPRRLLRLRR
ncbi:unnamed protein product [Cyclocybe aegerita]|uniref:Nephrocystin 3-like N-terminal domain-containing protein n=1 Tax=Cyclocybe aegerita TaxID=1973307 RepID=A0A8S0WF52_CYCAE|nr:unnamed protein product [Cyclocybe aegerita]